MDWRERLIDFFQVASILSGAIFAAMALFTDYKKDGKVTKYGRIAVIGIVASALFSLGTRWAQVGLAEDERQKAQAEAAAAAKVADAERDQEARKFAAQMAGLSGLADRLSALQGRTRQLNRGMDASLKAQDLLLTTAGRSMLMTARLGIQERENTGHVLRTMWQDANRVDGDSIELFTAYICLSKRGAKIPNLLDRADSQAMLSLTPAAQADSMTLPSRGFSHFFSMEGPEVLTAWRRETLMHSGDDILATYMHRFSSFMNDDMSRFASIEAWRGGAVRILVSTTLDMSEAELAGVFEVKLGGLPELAKVYEFGPGQLESLEQSDLNIRMLPCEAFMHLQVNGRMVMASPAALVLVSNKRYDQAPQLIFQTFTKRVSDDAIPRFGTPN